MRILFISRDFPPAVGGIQTTVANLAAALVHLGHEVVVLAPCGGRGDGGRPYEVVRLSVPWQKMNAAAVGALVQLTARRRFDVTLHALWHTLPGAFAARAMGRLGGVAAIAHGRELLHNEHVGVLRRHDKKLRRFLVRRVDRWFAVSRFTAGLLEADGVLSDRVAVVHGGVDTSRFQPHPPLSSTWGLRYVAEPLLVTVCRLVPRKGIDTVLRALPEVRDRVPSVRYLVGGVGPDLERLRRLRDALGLRGTVRFIGHVPADALPSLLSDATGFVMPARSEPPDVEGFGLAFLEANACRTPVVGAADGGVVDAVEHGVSGLLVPPSDHRVLAETLVRLLEEAPRREAMAEAGLRRVQNRFSWSHLAARYAAGLESIAR